MIFVFEFERKFESLAPYVCFWFCMHVWSYLFYCTSVQGKLKYDYSVCESRPMFILWVFYFQHVCVCFSLTMLVSFCVYVSVCLLVCVCLFVNVFVCVWCSLRRWNMKLMLLCGLTWKIFNIFLFFSLYTAHNFGDFHYQIENILIL